MHPNWQKGIFPLNYRKTQPAMKKTTLLALAFAFAVPSVFGGTIVVPNGDFTSTSNWTINTTTVGIFTPTANISGGTANVTGLVGLSVLGSNSAQFYQTITGQTYQPSTIYTMSATITSSVSLVGVNLGTNGIGLALTAGGNSTVVAASAIDQPLSLVGGNVYRLTFTYETPAGSAPVGDIGVRLYAGMGATGLSVNLLGNVKFDDVTLTTTSVPEPSTVGLFITGFCAIILVRRRRALRNLVVVGAAMLAMNTNSQAGLLPNLNLPTNLALNVTLLPDTQYTITLDVSTDAVSSVLALVTGGDSPVQIVDQVGNVIAEIPAQDLVDALTGATGTITTQLNTVIQTAGDAVVDPVAKVLDNSVLQVTNVTVTPTSPAMQSVQPTQSSVNLSPTVQIKSRTLSGLALKLKGVAADDRGIAYVTVSANGRQRHAVGTAKWNARLKLHVGKNKIAVQAFDASGNASAPKRLTVKAD